MTMPKNYGRANSARPTLIAAIADRVLRVAKIVAERYEASTPTNRRIVEREIERKDRRTRGIKVRSRLIYGSARAKAAAAVGVGTSAKSALPVKRGRLRLRSQPQKRHARIHHASLRGYAGNLPLPKPWKWQRAAPRPGRADKTALDRDYDAAIAKRERQNLARAIHWTGARG